MRIVDKIFNKATAISAKAVREEIAHAEGQIATHRANLDSRLSNIAMMDDAQHRAAEDDMAVIKRSIARLEAQVSQLAAELPGILAAEEIAAKIASDEALRKRAEASRRACTKEAAALLQQYGKLAEQVADIMTRLDEISAEATAVNSELRRNPVADYVASYNETHRKQPDRKASERREFRLGWVHGDGSFTVASIGKDGSPIPTLPSVDAHGRLVPPRLDRREVVVERIPFRAGHREEPLTSVHLPPAVAGQAHFWPRRRH